MPQHVIEPAEVCASRSAGDVLWARGIETGVGVVVCDPAGPVAGIANVRTEADADRAIDALLAEIDDLGGERNELTVKLAGGCRGMTNDARRIYAAVRKALWRSGVLVDAEDLGGLNGRQLVVNVSDGAVLLKAGAHPGKAF